jgi:hypothetical protein
MNLFTNTKKKNENNNKLELLSHKTKKPTDDKKGNSENVKYEFRQGGEDLKKIIPFCNNHFIIQERDK